MHTESQYDIERNDILNKSLEIAKDPPVILHIREGRDQIGGGLGVWECGRISG